jgi:hypothetical protein
MQLFSLLTIEGHYKEDVTLKGSGYADQIDHPVPIHFIDLLPI